MEGKPGAIAPHQVTLQPSTTLLIPRCAGFRPPPKRLYSRLAARRPQTEASLSVLGNKYIQNRSQSRSTLSLSMGIDDSEDVKKGRQLRSTWNRGRGTKVSVVKLPDKTLRHQLSKVTGLRLNDTCLPRDLTEDSGSSFPPPLPPIILHTVEVKFRPKLTHLKDPLTVLMTLLQSRRKPVSEM